MRRARSLRRQRAANKAIVAALSLIALVPILFPIYWMLNVSVRPIREILTSPPSLIPTTVTLEYFQRILQRAEYLAYYRNSIVLTVVTLIATLFFATLAAYGLSRYRLRGRNVIMLSIVSVLMLPPVLLVIPYFRLAHVLGVFDTIFALMIFNVAYSLPICTWLMKGYMDNTPRALEESAMMDGCNRLQAIWLVLLPVMRPALVGTGTFVVVKTWNEYIMAITLTDSPNAQPLTVGLAQFFGQYIRDWNSIMALTALSVAPLIVLFISFQRYVIQGMSSGAVK